MSPINFIITNLKFVYNITQQKNCIIFKTNVNSHQSNTIILEFSYIDKRYPLHVNLNQIYFLKL